MRGIQIFLIEMFRIEMDTIGERKFGMDIVCAQNLARVASLDLVQAQVITPVIIARLGDGKTGNSNRPAAVVSETGIGSINGILRSQVK